MTIHLFVRTFGFVAAARFPAAVIVPIKEPVAAGMTEALGGQYQFVARYFP
jgi:hypothetical protein